MTTPQYVLKLPRPELRRGRALERLLSRTIRGTGSVPRELLSAFAFKSDEMLFARQLLARRTSLWLFRSHQRRFCGDFVVVDMASPDAARRKSWVLDLKLGAPLRLGGGGAGVQLKNADRAVAEIVAKTGALALPADPVRVTGGRRAVLHYFGVAPSR